MKIAIRATLLLALACAVPAVSQATTVTAKLHLQITRSGAPVDISTGQSFDATDDEIAHLLPIGAISLGSGGGISPVGIVDASANAPAIPNVGAAFGNSGPYAGYVLVKTIATTSATPVDIENPSGGQIAIVRDDGTAASGTAPVNASVFPIAGGAGVGQQGGSWSATIKGRLEIYAPSSSANVTVLLN